MASINGVSFGNDLKSVLRSGNVMESGQFIDATQANGTAIDATGQEILVQNLSAEKITPLGAPIITDLSLDGGLRLLTGGNYPINFEDGVLIQGNSHDFITSDTQTIFLKPDSSGAVVIDKGSYGIGLNVGPGEYFGVNSQTQLSIISAQSGGLGDFAATGIASERQYTRNIQMVSPNGSNSATMTGIDGFDRVLLNGDLQFLDSRDSLLVLGENRASSFGIRDSSGQNYISFDTRDSTARMTLGRPLQGGAWFAGTVGLTLTASATLDFVSTGQYYNIQNINLTVNSASPITVNFTNAGIQRIWEVRLNAINNDCTFSDISLTATSADVGRVIRFWTNGSGTIFQVRYFT